MSKSFVLILTSLFWPASHCNHNRRPNLRIQQVSKHHYKLLYSLKKHSLEQIQRQISVSMQIPLVCFDRIRDGGVEEQTPPRADPHAAAWKATSISAQTSAVTQIRQPQCSGLLSPPTGGGQPDLRRMETFSPRNGQNQLLPSSINATPSLSAPRVPL